MRCMIVRLSAGVMIGAVALTGCKRDTAGSAAAGPVAPAVASSAVMPVEHDGLSILEARWGSGTEVSDVRLMLENRIKNGRLELTADSGELGDPAPNKKKQLMVVFDVKGKQTTQWFAEGAAVAIGMEAAAGPTVAGVGVAPAGGAGRAARGTARGRGAAGRGAAARGGAPPPATPAPAPPAPAAVASAPPVDHEGLTIVEAIWGSSTTKTPMDVRSKVESLISKGRLDFAVSRRTLGNPVGTGTPFLRVVYVVDGQQSMTMVREGDTMAIGVPVANVAQKPMPAPKGVAPAPSPVAPLESMPRPMVATGAVVDTQTLEKPVSLLQGYIAAESAMPERTAEGLNVRVDRRYDGKMETIEEYRTPLVITAQVKTDDTNIRLFFGEHGVVIFNWEENGSELRMHDPLTGEIKGIPGKGSVPKNTWVTVKWTIDEKESRVEVDGTERYTLAGNFSGLVGRVGIGQTQGSLVSLRKLDIARPADAGAGAAATAPAGPVSIVEAKWGAGGQMQDVTAKVQDLAKDGRLEMTADVGTLGDPVPGTVKELVLTYAAKGARQTVRFAENDAVASGAVGGTQLTADETRLWAAQRKAQPAGLILMHADWGKKGALKDETEVVRALVSGDSLTVKVVAGMFGDGDTSKQMRLLYDEGNGPVLTVVGMGQTLQLGKKVTSYVTADGQPVSVDKLPTGGGAGLVVLSAGWGDRGRWKDVTTLCASMVAGDSLSLLAKAEAFGQKGDGNLSLTYRLAGELRQVKVANGRWLQLGPQVTSFMQLGKGLVGVTQALSAARAKQGDGLLILDATYGEGNRLQNISDLVQSEISGNRLAIKVGDNWPDPAFGSEKDLTMTYWDGEAVQKLAAHQGTTIDLSGKIPPALRAMVMLPRYLPVGQSVVHNFGVKGVYAMKTGPKGAAISADGHMTWTPTADQLGMQEIQFSIQLDGKQFVQKLLTEVVSKDVVTAVGGDLSKLENLMRLNMAGEKHEYVVNADMSGGLLLEPDHVLVLGADGTTVVRKVPLAKEYFKIGERRDYFVAVRLKPAAMELLDKNTGRVIRTIKLDYREVYDLALVPNKPVSYVGASVVDTVPNGRLVMVDEDKGEVREPKGLMGNTVAIDRSGKHMWSGLHDLYRNGTEYYVNPGFNVVDIPTYGDIDYLLAYDLTADGPVLRQRSNQVGLNGGAIRISPDGKRVTYLSFTGYPSYSKNVGAWDGLDFEKKPVVYDVKDAMHGEPVKSMDYHPLLPLVVMAKGDGVLVFGRESGDREDQRVKIAPGVLVGVVVKDARFSPDGLNVILECQKGGEWFMYKMPLILSEQEKALVKKGIPAEETPAAPVRLGIRA